jgi:hypothetical protein
MKTSLIPFRINLRPGVKKNNLASQQAITIFQNPHHNTLYNFKTPYVMKGQNRAPKAFKGLNKISYILNKVKIPNPTRKCKPLSVASFHDHVTSSQLSSTPPFYYNQNSIDNHTNLNPSLRPPKSPSINPDDCDKLPFGPQSSPTKLPIV